MKYIGILILGISVIAFSCKKPAGEGGKAKITGTIWVENYSTLMNMYDQYEFKGEYPGEDEDVYVIYGDEIGYGDKVKAGPDGRFVFDNLRAGNYRIYVQSKDTNRTSPSGVMTIQTTVTLSKKGTKDVGTLLIYN